MLGGAMLVVVFEGAGDAPERGAREARRIVKETHERPAWEGESPARRWLDHRYAVSYRQAPVFANGAFVDTMEVAATWSKLGGVYDASPAARSAKHVFVMAHFSPRTPTAAASTSPRSSARRMRRPPGRAGGSPGAPLTYDRAWRDALDAAIGAGGTLAHHHGVGRSKAPRLTDEIGLGVGVVRGLMRNLRPRGDPEPWQPAPTARR